MTFIVDDSIGRMHSVSCEQAIKPATNQGTAMRFVIIENAKYHINTCAQVIAAEVAMRAANLNRVDVYEVDKTGNPVLQDYGMWSPSDS